MTTVGHTLIGLTVATLVLPRSLPNRKRVVFALWAILFASLPDLPLPGWGHNNYMVSHSLFVTSGLSLLLMLATTMPSLPWRLNVTVVLSWVVAWHSHPVMDSMYSHGRGIAIFWPVSDAHLVLTVPWLDTLHLPARSAHNLRVFAIEALCFGTVLLLSVVLRRSLHRA